MQIQFIPHSKYGSIPVTKKDKDTYHYVKTNIKYLDDILQNFELKNPQKLEAVDQSALKGTNDLLNLGNNTLLNIHATLRKNFFNQQYQTQIGDNILLVTNPNKEINGLYTKGEMKKNKLIRFQVNQSNEALIQEPHLFKLGRIAELKMKESNHAAIIISGEKGSGKSYQCGKLIEYLQNESKSGYFNTGNLGDAPIKTKTIDTNVIIDAFGTALKENNQYSSRFGKLITLIYELQPQNSLIIGAHVDVFLLENTRVSHGESNFQIFSYLISASKQIKNLKNTFNKVLQRREDQDIEDKIMDDNKLDQISQIIENLCLDKIEKYNYLRKIDKSQEENAESFATFIISLNNLDFDIKLIEEILISLSSVLIIGNIFDKQASEKDEALLQLSKLLGTDSHQLFESLTKSPSKMIYKEQEIQNFKSALAKFIYQVCFDKVMEQINKSLKPNKDESTLKSISILETLGFEIKKNADGLQNNGLEQLLMNYVHEKIVNMFLNHLKKEDVEYYKKQIQYDLVNYADNSSIIELFESNKLKSNRQNGQMCGILDQIQTNAQISRENKDKDLQQIIGNIAHEKLSVKANLTRTVLKNDEENKLMQRVPQSWFMIQHTSGNVYYIVDNWGQKNQESLNSQLVEAIGKSKIKFIQQKVNGQTLENSISLSQSQRTNRLAKFTTSTFRSSLKKIEDKLKSFPLLFLVCLKSKSDSDETVQFDDQQFLKQIKFNALDSVIQIQLQKYPKRMSHQEFINRYNPELKNQEDICQFIQNNETLTRAIIQVGNTDVLMKPLAYLYLEQGGHKQQQQQQEVQQEQKQEIAESLEAIIQRLKDQNNTLEIEKEIEIQKRINAENELLRNKKQVESLKPSSEQQKLVEEFIKKWQNLNQDSQDDAPVKEPLQRESISQISQIQQLDQSFLSEKNNSNTQQKFIPQIDQLITSVSEYLDLYSQDDNEEQLEQSRIKTKECFIQVEGYLKQYSIL